MLILPKNLQNKTQQLVQNPVKILLIEDDKALGEGIKSALSHLQYLVDWFDQGKAGLAALRVNPYDLVILDLGLPDLSGMEVLRHIRHTSLSKTPVIILTARDQIDDKIQGLDGGADDYMIKPFDIRELDARIRSLTRRARGQTSNGIEIGRAVLQPQERRLCLDNTTFEFPRREFEILQAMFQKPKQVFTREMLESLAYTLNESIESNAIEVHIHRLRKKLGSQAIRTIRGIGYRFNGDHFK